MALYSSSELRISLGSIQKDSKSLTTLLAAIEILGSGANNSRKVFILNITTVANASLVGIGEVHKIFCVTEQYYM